MCGLVACVWKVESDRTWSAFEVTRRGKKERRYGRSREKGAESSWKGLGCCFLLSFLILTEAHVRLHKEGCCLWMRLKKVFVAVCTVACWRTMKQKKGQPNNFILNRECFNDWPIAPAVALVCFSTSIPSFPVPFLRYCQLSNAFCCWWSSPVFRRLVCCIER